MKSMIIAAALAGMLGFAAHGQAVPSHETGPRSADHCWVKPMKPGGIAALTDLRANRHRIEPVNLTAIC